jgi:hypothetical protein
LLAKYLYNCSKFSSSLFKKRSKGKRWTRVLMKKREKENKDMYATKFLFIFKVQKREVIFKYGAL